MAAFNKKSSQLHTFNITHDSVVDGTKYHGSFTVKKLSIRDLSALGVRKAQLNGGLHFDMENPGRGVDETTDQINNMMAHLEIALVNTPPWWNLDDITDMDLLASVYQEVISFENSFLERRLRANTGASSQEGSQETQEQSNAAGVSQPLVDPQVQASLEP